MIENHSQELTSRELLKNNEKIINYLMMKQLCKLDFIDAL